MNMMNVIPNWTDWIELLPVSRGGGIVVEEGEHVQLEGVVLLPDNGDGKIDQNMMARIEFLKFVSKENCERQQQLKISNV